MWTDAAAMTYYYEYSAVKEIFDAELFNWLFVAETLDQLMLVTCQMLHKWRHFICNPSECLH